MYVTLYTSYFDDVSQAAHEIIHVHAGFHLGFLSRGGGANATIPELRGGKDYSIFFHP